MRYLLVLLGLLVANVAQAVDCQTVPSCTELGYTKELDPNCKENGYLPCPFDTTYHKCVNMDCEKLGFTKEDKSSWCGKIVSCRADKTFTACKALCEIGDVYYADGTCGYVQDYDNTKIPVGVVFYVTDDGRHGKVVNLQELTFDENSNFDPANPFGQNNRQPHFGLGDTDPQLPFFSTYQDLVNALQSHDPKAFAGLENTEILIKTSPANGNCSNGNFLPKTLNYNMYCQATMALAAHNFYPPRVEPTNPFTGQGRWYMPSVGELVLLWNPDMSKLQLVTNGINPNVEGVVRNKVNETLQSLRNRSVTVDLLSGEGANFLWSSSLSNGSSYYAVHIRGDGNISGDGAIGVKPMRAMLAF